MSRFRTFKNISERALIAKWLLQFVPPIRMSTIEWGKTYRTLDAEESTLKVGSFDPNTMPFMEYVYECLDNPYIPSIVSMKSARIGWTEVINTYRGKRMHTQPCNMLLGFATASASKKFASGKWRKFIQNTPVLKAIINVGIAKNKESMYQYNFTGGQLNLSTLGSIINQKGDNIPYMEVEEPDDVGDEVSGQGDTFKNLAERQKLVPKTQKKFIFGGTPTDKDFSRVESAMKRSNWLIFKAECHVCKTLVPMDGSAFNNITYAENLGKRIDTVYGKFDPSSARFNCPTCDCEWSFEQKTLNIIAGKQHGFIDHTGVFSKGWHPKYPHVKETFGFAFSELLSTFKDGSDYCEIAKDMIHAEMELAKGNEAPLKSYVNNRRGEPYTSAIASLEEEDMIALRSNYPEHVMPYEALLPFIGIDVQHSRFAITILAAGRNNNIYLISWFEIFGKVTDWEDDVWTRLTNIVLMGVPHVTGATVDIQAGSIDCQDGGTAELVYRWVRHMNDTHKVPIYATRGCNSLEWSVDEIYQEPYGTVLSSEQEYKRSLAETMGVLVYRLGTHKCQEEILRRIGLNAKKDEEGRLLATQDVFFFNEQSYGGYENQMTACRKVIDLKGKRTKNKQVFRLIPGKHMDAMAATKNAFHAMYAKRIREYTNEHWNQVEAGILPADKFINN